MLVESLDDTLVVDGKKHPKGDQFEMRNIGAAMNAVADGLVVAVERPLRTAHDIANPVDKAALKEAAQIAAAESQPGTVPERVKGKK